MHLVTLLPWFSCPVVLLCNLMDFSTPGLCVSHHLRKFAPVHVHCIGDATQSFHPLMPSSPSALSFPVSETFPMSQLFSSDDQNTGASASASVLPRSIQDWFPLRLTGLISLLSKGLSEVFSSTQFRGINSSALSLLYCPAFTTIHNHWGYHSLDYTFVGRVMSLLFNTLSRFVIDFLQEANVFWFHGCSYIHHDFRAWEEKSVTAFTFCLSVCCEVMGPDAMILVFLIFSFKPALSLSSFALIKRLFSIINTLIHTCKWMWKQWK